MTTIVIGLDGANWQMIDQWIEDGILPNLSQLIDTGIGGISESCLPPLTVPNWKCYSTGKNPGKLDVFRFDKINTDAREHTFHDATDFKSAELWEYLNEGGYTTGIINKPSTYPPKPVDGFVIAGGPDASNSEFRTLDSGFTYPADLADELRDSLDYSVHPSPMISPSEKGEDEVAAILELISSRFDAAEYLLKQSSVDFLHMTAFYNMALQHYFWRDEPVRRAWEVIDQNLSRFMNDGHDLIIMSDHGTCKVESVFYINVWLAERGYLATQRNIDNVLRTVGITRERALSVAKRFGLVDGLSTHVPEQLQKMVPWEEGIKRDRILSIIDWEKTDAVASTQGPVYLTPTSETPEFERLRETLITELTELSHPETGTVLINDVHRGEEYYTGSYASNAPDLLLEQGPNVHISDAVGPANWYASSGVWKGGNMPDGLFLMNGPSFRNGGLNQRANIVDIAPTILHLFDLPIPEDMDGKVLDVFSTTYNRPVEYGPPLERDHHSTLSETNEIAERLADLGYLE
ncbi:alkaline phosphatase family protein [Natronosalvus amylolyticus]|uniref:alkaline phosphatase family protein n=1 Tax=Natronosalvus amylolyticus TaxID=2961994 RepID=UPI002115B2A7|nr:alkaline phosphatase family protein [Natronosalvus amylolyticus]